MGIDEGVWSYRLRPTLPPPRRPPASHGSGDEGASQLALSDLLLMSDEY